MFIFEGYEIQFNLEHNIWFKIWISFAKTFTHLKIIYQKVASTKSIFKIDNNWRIKICTLKKKTKINSKIFNMVSIKPHLKLTDELIWRKSFEISYTIILICST